MKKLNQIFLLVYSFIVTTGLIITLIWFSGKINTRKNSFEELEVQQIRIVEPDGTLRMIISNAENEPVPHVS